MINPKRLDAIRKLRNDASYGYATVTSQVYAKDIQELLDECERLTIAYNAVAPELERQRARAYLSEYVANRMLHVLKAVANNEDTANLHDEVAACDRVLNDPTVCIPLGVVTDEEARKLVEAGIARTAEDRPLMDVLEGGD